MLAKRDRIYSGVFLRTLIWLLAVFVAGLVLTDCARAEKPLGHVVTEYYTVVSGDTLDDISYKFMAKSSVRRDVREFRCGIEELNWDIFKNRQRGMIYPGDRLQVNYWVSDEPKEGN